MNMVAEDDVATTLEQLSIQDDASLPPDSVSPTQNSLFEVILDQQSPRPEPVKEKIAFRDEEVDELLDWIKLVRKPQARENQQEQHNFKTCSPGEYLEKSLFPVLLPAIDHMLSSAKENEVFERKRTKFNACDFITEYLYRNNPAHGGRSDTELGEIPFVKEILAKNPRPPLPLSLQWSESQAAVCVQAFWKGYVVRKRPDVAELREYQKEMREASYHIMSKVEDFWKEHPMKEPTKD